MCLHTLFVIILVCINNDNSLFVGHRIKVINSLKYVLSYDQVIRGMTF